MLPFFLCNTRLVKKTTSTLVLPNAWSESIWITSQPKSQLQDLIKFLGGDNKHKNSGYFAKLDLFWSH